MIYTIVAGLFFLIAFLCLWLALWALWNAGWVLGWLRGNIGVLLLAFAAIFVFVAVDISTYHQLNRDGVVATLSVEQKSPQNFVLTLGLVSGEENKYEISGDLWQLEGRALHWREGYNPLGLQPAYRLVKISGRYYSLEQERHAPKSIQSLSRSRFGVDMWAALEQFNAWWLTPFRGENVSVRFVPMADGALYQLVLTETQGMIVRPLNDRAKALGLR